MIRTVDSSVLIAAFATWHSDHERARLAITRRPTVVGHVLAETFSVLTRLPQPQRADPADVAAFLEFNLSPTPLVLDADEVRALPHRLVELGISGSATYDALIALTAQRFDATLVSLDRRAEATYRRCGASVDFLEL